MNFNVRDFGFAHFAFVVLDPRVNLPVVLQKLGQRFESELAIWTTVIPRIGSMGFFVSVHPVRVLGPEPAAFDSTVEPLGRDGIGEFGSPSLDIRSIN